MTCHNANGSKLWLWSLPKKRTMPLPHSDQARDRGLGSIAWAQRGRAQRRPISARAYLSKERKAMTPTIEDLTFEFTALNDDQAVAIAAAICPATRSMKSA